jgi:hypothetical protein
MQFFGNIANRRGPATSCNPLCGWLLIIVLILMFGGSMRSEFRYRVEEQFKAESLMMLAKVDTAKHTTSHPTIYGTHNEMILIEFLRRYLPSRFSVCQGQIVNPNGDLSPQCNIIIHDQTIFPPAMVFENGARIVYAHAVYAVIEVKTTLANDNCHKALENLKLVRDLEVTTQAHFLNHPKFREHDEDIIVEHLQNDPEDVRRDMRIHKFIFAYRCSSPLDIAIGWLRAHRDSNHRAWPLNKACVLSFNDGPGEVFGPDILGLQDSRSYSKGENALLAFYRTLYNALCEHDKVEPGTLDLTKEIIKEYKPWGLMRP